MCWAYYDNVADYIINGSNTATADLNSGVGKNTIQFQAVEDYADPSGSFLVVEIEPPVEGASTSISSGQSAKGASASKGIPGFKIMPSIALILIISLTFRRCKKGNQND